MAVNNINIGVELRSKLEKSEGRIAELREKGAFGSNKKAEQDLAGIVQELKALSNVSNPSYKQLTRMNSLFTQMSEIMLKVAKSTNLTSQEFQRLEKQLKNEEKTLVDLKKARGSIKSQGRINSKSGQYELYKTYQEEVIRGANIQSAKGNQIKGYNTFFKGFDNGKAKEGYFQDAAAAQTIYDSLKRTEQNNAKRLEELNAEIEKYTTQLKETTQKLVEQAAREGAPIQGSVVEDKTNFDLAVEKAKEEKHEVEDANKETSQVGVTASLKKQESALGKAFKAFTIYSIAVRSAKKALREAVVTIKELDKYLTEQAMVTGKTREETYALVGAYQKLAVETGATTKEIASVATEYMKQGKTIQESLTLTKAAVSAAKVARVSVGDSVNYLTTALNGFRLSAEDAMKVSDKFAAVAASSATDYDELAIALSKVASQANLAGMSIDYTTALLTKGLETTREAPETMGTALKTIIARMRELGDYGETLEDGTDINNVETQLAYVDIALRDQQGELRSTEEVLDELGRKWDTLNKNQQAAVAKALAGTRQQSRLIAMMEDYERVIELQEISQRSQGATLAQSATYLEGIEAKINRISVAWESIVTNLVNSKLVIGFLETIGSLLENIGAAFENEWVIWTTMAPLAVVFISHMLHKNELQKQQNRLILEEQKGKVENKILDKEASIAAKTKVLYALKHLKNQKATTKEKAKQAKLDDNGLNDAEAEKILQEANLSGLKEEAEIDREISKITNEIKLEEAEVRGLKLEEKQLSIDIAANGAGLSSVYGNILTILTPVLGIMQLINLLQIAGLKLRKEEGKQIKKNNAEETKGLIPKVKGMFARVVSAFAKDPISAAAGIALATGLAAALGVAIFAAFGGFKSKASKEEKAAKDIKNLSNEIYKLNESKVAIAATTSEFEKLDNKIIKTNKDLEEMESLLEKSSESIDFTQGGKYDEDEAKDRKAEYEAMSAQRKVEWLRQEEKAINDRLWEKRQEQIEKLQKLTQTGRRRLLEEDAEVASAMYAINNAYLYEQVDKLKESNDYTDEELKATEKIGERILDNLDAQEAYNFAVNRTGEAIANIISSLGKMNVEVDGKTESVDVAQVLASDNYSLKDQVAAFKEIASHLSGASLDAFRLGYQSIWDFSRQFNDSLLTTIEELGITGDEINSIAEAMRKIGVEEDDILNKLGGLISKVGYGMELNTAITTTFAQELAAAGNEAEDLYKTILNAYTTATGLGIGNMGQNIDKLQNQIHSFYESVEKWGEMTATEKTSFMSDNAEMFKENPELYAALESGDYTKIEEILSNNEWLRKRRNDLLDQINTEIYNESARGADADVSYLQYLEAQKKYWSDTENIYKANLKIIIEAEQAQLDEYKKLLEKKHDAEVDSLEKRKEAYQKYFNDIKEGEEDADFEEQANLLATNLAKLGSSTDASAMNQKRDLEKQLRELEEERLKELRERAQENVINNIDDELSEINEKFDKLIESNQELLKALRGKDATAVVAQLLTNRIMEGATGNEAQQYVRDLDSTFGSSLGNVDLDNIRIKQENNNLYLTVNGQNILLDTANETNLYNAIMKALTEIGGI